MADRLNIEIDPRLVPYLLKLAEEQRRAPDMVIRDALLLYLRELGLEAEPGSNIGKQIGEIYVEFPDEPMPDRDRFLALMNRISSRFDLDEDEAMSLAVEEQKAFRSERAERERERTQR